MDVTIPRVEDGYLNRDVPGKLRRMLEIELFIAIALVFLIFPVTAYPIHAFNLPGDQIWPEISGDIVVFQEFNSDPYGTFQSGLYMYDFRYPDRPPQPVSTNFGSLGDPVSISGNMIVWDDGRNQATTGRDIYMYDLDHPEKGEQPVCIAPGDQFFPEVSDNRIIWVDERNYNSPLPGNDLTQMRDLWILDLNIPDSIPVLLFKDPGDQEYPAISGNIITFLNTTENGIPIYYYDLSNSAAGTRLIKVDGGNYGVPRVSGNIIVWPRPNAASRFASDIYYYDIIHRKRGVQPLSPVPPEGRQWISMQAQVAISDNLVAWQDWSPIHDAVSIFLYDLNHPRWGAILVDETDHNWANIEQSEPAISGNRIVWTNDYHDDNKGTQLMWAEISATPPPPPLLRDFPGFIPDAEFRKSPTQRRAALQAMVDKINSMIVDENYKGAGKLLEHDLKDKIENWLIDDYFPEMPMQLRKDQVRDLIDYMIRRLKIMIK